MKNYYEILEISSNASQEIIEKSYKILAKRYHPDLQPKDKLYWAEVQMKEINEAYSVLSDPVAKAQYDNELLKSRMDFERKYNDLYSRHEELKQQIENDNYQNPTTNEVQIKNHKFVPANMMSKFNFNSYSETIKNTIYNERHKPANERKKDFIAMILTLIIVSIIVILFWKVPFLNKFI